MYHKKTFIIAATSLTFAAYGCAEECNSDKFSSYCDGNTIVYCAYDGGIENADKQTVIHEDCADIDPNAPFCVEVQEEGILFLRASCVISKNKDPNCTLEDPKKSYCKDTSTHYCYYGYTTWVSGKGQCVEQTSSNDQSTLNTDGATR